MCPQVGFANILMKKEEFKKGDLVQITDFKSPKYKMTGTVVSIFANGVMIKITNKDTFTPVKFSHLTKI